MKHKSAVADGVAIRHKPDHVITVDMGFIIKRVLLSRLIHINTVCLKMFGNSVFLPETNRAKYSDFVFDYHIVKIPFSEITYKTAFAKTVVTFFAFPNMIVLFINAATTIFLIT